MLILQSLIIVIMECIFFFLFYSFSPFCSLCRFKFNNGNLCKLARSFIKNTMCSAHTHKTHNRNKTETLNILSRNVWVRGYGCAFSIQNQTFVLVNEFSMQNEKQSASFVFIQMKMFIHFFFRGAVNFHSCKSSNRFRLSMLF